MVSQGDVFHFFLTRRDARQRLRVTSVVTTPEWNVAADSHRRDNGVRIHFCSLVSVLRLCHRDSWTRNWLQLEQDESFYTAEEPRRLRIVNGRMSGLFVSLPSLSVSAWLADPSPTAESVFILLSNERKRSRVTSNDFH